ncbi:MAG: hypothetical protein GX590_10950 [Lentisphaerae bacterium]|nr:hypothetical protein [Lentisphaerota bacterium]
MKDGGEFVTREACGVVSRRVLEKLENIERRFFKDNGTLSIQTRLNRHERVLRVLLWAASVMAGTLLASWTLGLYSQNLLPTLSAARLRLYPRPAWQGGEQALLPVAAGLRSGPHPLRDPGRRRDGGVVRVAEVAEALQFLPKHMA